MGTPSTSSSIEAWRALLGPLVLAHFVAYPLAFASALASLPLAMLLRKRALLLAGNEGASYAFFQRLAKDLALGPVEAAQLEIVLEFALGVSVLVGLTVHLSALPWALCSRRAALRPELGRAQCKGPQRRFVRLAAALSAILLVVGGAGWIWVLTL